MATSNSQVLGGQDHAHGPRHRRDHLMERGYESPSDEDHLAFFAHGHSHTSAADPGPMASGAAAVTSVHPGATHGPRPPFSSRPSYVAVAHPAAGGNGHDAHQPTLTPGATSLNGVIAETEKIATQEKVSIKDRIACYRWTFFTMTMATGGVANILHACKSSESCCDSRSNISLVPYKATWITGFGLFFFFLNISIFVMNCILISWRFYLRPGSFTQSFTDQVESLFVPAFFVSIGTIMINICEYGVPRTGLWLLRTMEVSFWIYVALAIFTSAGMYLILWSTLVFPIHMMTPTWVFPVYPLLLTAPFAANLIASAQESGRSLSLNVLAVALGAVTAQGTGCLIAFMISSAFVYRLMTQKLPRDMQRPGVFISIGPYGFTAAGITQLGSQAEIYIPKHFLATPHTVHIIQIVSILVGLWLWGLALWFFLVSVGSLWKYVRTGSNLPFQMTWWSFVFPNTALVAATQIMGKVFDNQGIQIFGSVMTAILIAVWIGVLITMIHCLKEKKLLWPKDNV